MILLIILLINQIDHIQKHEFLLYPFNSYFLIRNEIYFFINFKYMCKKKKMKLNQKKIFRFIFDEHILLTTYISSLKNRWSHLLFIYRTSKIDISPKRIKFLTCYLYVLMALHRCNTGNLAASSVRATKFTVFSRNPA